MAKRRPTLCVNCRNRATGRVRGWPVCHSHGGPKKARRNPLLITLSNPELEETANALPAGAGTPRQLGVPMAPAAWERFHRADRNRARMTFMETPRGVPDSAWALGLAYGIEMVDQHGDTEDVWLSPTRKDGPWLVAAADDDKRLWIVGRDPITDLLAYEGYRSASIYYEPPPNSGKYDPDRGYRHEWGEGGRYGRASWPEKCYPMLTEVDPDHRAYELTDGAYHVEPRGIVG